MPEILLTIEKFSSLLAMFFAFIFWILSRNFVTKNELQVETKNLNKESTENLKAIYNDVNRQKIGLVEVNTKIDNIIKTMDNLSTSINYIKEYLINNKKN